MLIDECLKLLISDDETFGVGFRNLAGVLSVNQQTLEHLNSVSFCNK